jgi:hypothetical protein
MKLRRERSEIVYEAAPTEAAPPVCAHLALPQYGDEDEIKDCVDKYQENRFLMDPTKGGIKTLSNTADMYHQPASNWQVNVPTSHCVSGCRYLLQTLNLNPKHHALRLSIRAASSLCHRLARPLTPSSSVPLQIVG